MTANVQHSYSNEGVQRLAVDLYDFKLCYLEREQSSYRSLHDGERCHPMNSCGQHPYCTDHTRKHSQPGDREDETVATQEEEHCMRSVASTSGGLVQHTLHEGQSVNSVLEQTIEFGLTQCHRILRRRVKTAHSKSEVWKTSHTYRPKKAKVTLT